VELLIIILVLAIFHYGRLKRIEAKLETGRGKKCQQSLCAPRSRPINDCCPSRKHRTLCNFADPEKRHPRCTLMNAVSRRPL